MKRTVTTFSLAAVLLLTTFSVSAEAITRRKSRFSLGHRSQLSLRLGVQDRSQIDEDYYYYDGVPWKHNTSEPVVSIGYDYFVDEQTAFTMALKVLESQSETGFGEFGLYTVDQSVVPLFFGVRRYLGPRSPLSPVRPYLTAMAGPVFGVKSLSFDECDCPTGTRTQTVAGAHFGGGVDFIVGRHFMLGLNAGYNLLADFDEPVAGHVNYSGAEFGVGFGFLF